MFSADHLHPMMVHFPIALIISGFLSEGIAFFNRRYVFFSKVGFYLLIFGTISAVLTLLSGLFFTPEMAGAAGEIRETHELLAWITVILLIATLAVRTVYETGKKSITPLKYAGVLLYVMATLSVIATGFYGGPLVFNYMMPL